MFTALMSHLKYCLVTLFSLYGQDSIKHSKNRLLSEEYVFIMHDYSFQKSFIPWVTSSII